MNFKKLRIIKTKEVLPDLLTIKQNGKYYQLGYYKKSKWIIIQQLGTPEKILEKYDVPLPETYQQFRRDALREQLEKYQKRIDAKKGTVSE
jgi:ABC-type glycerol-3-phosphate transport system substrate-binding protein